MRNVERNAKVIEKFIETDAALVGPGPPPDEPMRRFKGMTRPPATEAQMRFWDANVVISGYLNWRIAAYRGGRTRFATPLNALYGDPAIIQRWRAGETVEDIVEMATFQQMCRKMAASIAQCSRVEPLLRVTVNPRDEPQPNRTAAHHHDQRTRQAESHRRRYEKFRELERCMGVDEGQATRRAAKSEWSRIEGLSVPTIERAIAWAKQNGLETDEGSAA